MPELPDLEVFKENLSRLVLNKRIVSVKVLKAKVIVPLTEHEFAKQVKGNRIQEIGRRAKHIIFSLSNGSDLILHLMLHGELYHPKSADDIHPFTCAIFEMDDGYDLRFQDRTQWMKISFDKSALYELGIEPLSNEFTPGRFKDMVGKRNGMVKSVLMDQSFIAGIGHAYADEILFAAGIMPDKRLQQLTGEDVQRLFRAIRDGLNDAIIKVRKGLKGGITGEYRDFVSVRGREGQNCYKCKSIISSIKVSAQKAYFCPECQR